MSDLWQRARFWRDHRWAAGQMSAYLDGELGSGPRARVERHAHDCPECRRVLDGLRRVLGALHGLTPPSGGPAALTVAASVRGRLDEPPAS
jgi:anti-sigma factor RsiW